jgi:hypothetical protein
MNFGRLKHIPEYERAREELGDTEMGAPWKIYENQHSLGLTVLTELAGDLTMVHQSFSEQPQLVLNNFPAILRGERCVQL